MFTGLVEDIGTIERVLSGPMTELWIHTSLGAAQFEMGESIAIDGACLTVVERGGDHFRVQASPETLRRTTLGALGPGAAVNLERALRLSDRLGGHLVLGHVDAVTAVRSVVPEGGSSVMTFDVPRSLAPFFIEKGSVTVHGVSLTVNMLSKSEFSVALIPETRTRTTLGRKNAGDVVNIEADVIGKYVARLQGFRSESGGVSEEALHRAGFGSRE